MGQDTRHNIVGGVSFQDGFQGRVEVFEDRRGAEVGLKFLKHLLADRCPFDRGFIGTLLVGNRFQLIRLDGL